MNELVRLERGSLTERFPARFALEIFGRCIKVCPDVLLKARVHGKSFSTEVAHVSFFAFNGSLDRFVFVRVNSYELIVSFSIRIIFCY
jgi:hypothetical protein